MKSSRFLLSLVIFDRLVSITQSLSDPLQSTSLNLSKATDLVVPTIETLEEFQSGHSWDHFFAYVEDVANLHTLIYLDLVHVGKITAKSSTRYSGQ